MPPTVCPDTRPTQSPLATFLRFGLHWNVDVQEKRIIEGYGVFDLPGFFIQAGIDLFKRAHMEKKSRFNIALN